MLERRCKDSTPGSIIVYVRFPFRWPGIKKDEPAEGLNQRNLDSEEMAESKKMLKAEFLNIIVVVNIVNTIVVCRASVESHGQGDYTFNALGTDTLL